MLTNEMIRQEVSALHDYVLQLRRTVHQYAEVGGTEKDTRALIEQQLKEDGIAYTELEGMSVLAELDTGRPGPAILLRADIDALPMSEAPDNLKQPRTCISRTPDKTAHLCGHDAHTAMCLGACRLLSHYRDELCGTVTIVFESGEEFGLGFPVILKALEGRKFDACWAIHVYAGIPSGKLCVHEGPRMGGFAQIDVTFHGKGGHGSRPDLAINPLYCAANYINNMAVAFANQIDANQTVTLGITGVTGATSHNIIPDDTTVLGSMRFFNDEEGKKAVRIEKEVAEHTAAYNHCTVTFGEKVESDFTAPVLNDPELSRLAEDSIEKAAPGSVTDWEPWYASESYAKYLQRWPGVLCHLGIANPEKGTGASHHSTHFDVDEDVLDLGVTATAAYVAAVMARAEK